MIAPHSRHSPHRLTGSVQCTTSKGVKSGNQKLHDRFLSAVILIGIIVTHERVFCNRHPRKTFPKNNISIGKFRGQFVENPPEFVPKWGTPSISAPFFPTVMGLGLNGLRFSYPQSGLAADRIAHSVGGNAAKKQRTASRGKRGDDPGKIHGCVGTQNGVAGTADLQ
jgi:hypothetical protein